MAEMKFAGEKKLLASLREIKGVMNVMNVTIMLEYGFKPEIF